MGDRSVIDPRALGSTKGSELIRVEVRSVISDDAVRHAISEYQLSDETDGSACSKVLHGFGFDPLGKLVDCYEQMGEATRASFEGSGHIQSPDCRRADKWNSLQGRCGLVRHVGVKLATFTFVDYFFCHLVGMWPVKSGSVCFGQMVREDAW